MKKIIIIESDINTGEVSIEAVGFKGQACAKATEAYERALGGQVTARMKKPEYYAAGSTSATQNIGGAK